MVSEEMSNEDMLNVVFHYGGYPLWVYLKEAMGIDIVEVCDRVAKIAPVLKTSNGDLTVVVSSKAEAHIVSDPKFNNDKIFLLNSINVVFESLKAGVERDGVKILESLKFALDDDKCMYLIDAESKLPISSFVFSINVVE